jgi:hypothetical protein
MYSIFLAVTHKLLLGENKDPEGSGRKNFTIKNPCNQKVSPRIRAFRSTKRSMAGPIEKELLVRLL